MEGNRRLEAFLSAPVGPKGPADYTYIYIYIFNISSVLYLSHILLWDGTLGKKFDSVHLGSGKTYDPKCQVVFVALS